MSWSLDIPHLRHPAQSQKNWSTFQCDKCSPGVSDEGGPTCNFFCPNAICKTGPKRIEPIYGCLIRYSWSWMVTWYSREGDRLNSIFCPQPEYFIKETLPIRPIIMILRRLKHFFILCYQGNPSIETVKIFLVCHIHMTRVPDENITNICT